MVANQFWKACIGTLIKMCCKNLLWGTSIAWYQEKCCWSTGTSTFRERRTLPRCVCVTFPINIQEMAIRVFIFVCLLAAPMAISKPTKNNALDKATENDVIINTVRTEGKLNNTAEGETSIIAEGKSTKGSVIQTSVSFATPTTNAVRPGVTVARIIDDIFQIPISVLQSVSRLLTNPFLSHTKTPETNYTETQIVTSDAYQGEVQPLPDSLPVSLLAFREAMRANRESHYPRRQVTINVDSKNNPGAIDILTLRKRIKPKRKVVVVLPEKNPDLTTTIEEHSIEVSKERR